MSSLVQISVVQLSSTSLYMRCPDLPISFGTAYEHRPIFHTTRRSTNHKQCIHWSHSVTPNVTAAAAAATAAAGMPLNRRWNRRMPKLLTMSVTQRLPTDDIRHGTSVTGLRQCLVTDHTTGSYHQCMRLQLLVIRSGRPNSHYWQSFPFGLKSPSCLEMYRSSALNSGTDRFSPPKFGCLQTRRRHEPQSLLWEKVDS